MQNVSSGHINGGRMSVISQSRYDRLTGDSWNWLFTRGINIRHESEICPIERRSELLLQRLCPSVAMRLKHHDDPLVLKGARGLECSSNLSRMMTVIVHDRVRLGLQLHFKSSLGPLERLKPFRNLAKRHSYLHRQRNNCQGVANVVSARNSEG